MPTSSSIFAQTITNWGPLPTDFTIPAACATSTLFAIAPSGQPDAPIWHDCRSQTDVCVPAPTDPSAPEDGLEANIIPGDGLLAAFYSPGISCPSGWKTVGVAVRDGDNSLSRSGFLASATPGPGPIFYNPDDVLVALLDPSETAVWCCPSSMTVGAQDDYCYSTLPDYSLSTACRTFFTQDDIATYTTSVPGDDGHLTDGEIYMITATRTGTVESTTFSAREATDYVALSQIPAIRFVHQPSDLAGGGESNNDEGDDDEGESDSEEPSETNGAGRLGASERGPLGGIVGSLVASVLAGVAVVLLR
ncbi:uncharacterized protein BJX67DRAFT_352175 [Aspergillus lucknowensis]|uniref:Uncharacterized protein n=1 Tax=Aspergillus lucknowensis TaxID=176173 RepID=A0ABR4LT73_9EURO